MGVVTNSQAMGNIFPKFPANTLLQSLIDYSNTRLLKEPEIIFFVIFVFGKQKSLPKFLEKNHSQFLL